MKPEPKVTLALAQEHGLSREEFERACAAVGRDLTWPELVIRHSTGPVHCTGTGLAQ